MGGGVGGGDFKLSHPSQLCDTLILTIQILPQCLPVLGGERQEDIGLPGARHVGIDFAGV